MPKIYCYTKPTVSYVSKKCAAIKYLGFLDYLYINLSIITSFKNNSKTLFREHALPEEESLNNLWEQSKIESEFCLERNSQYWKYRYLDNPKEKYLFYEVKNRSAFAGIVVCKYQDDEKKYVFVEWMINKEVSIRHVFSQVILHGLKKYNPDTFSLWMNENEYSKTKLKNLLFFKRGVYSRYICPYKIR